MRDLTDKEWQVVNMLGEAWNVFTQLEPSHPSDLEEFAQAVHVAQNIVFARPATEVAKSDRDNRHTTEVPQ